MSSYGFIKELIKKEHTPTPAYVFDLDKMKEFVKKVQSCLGESAQLCYAMKANPFLTGPMMDVVPTFEVCSPGEFRICERVGVPMERIVLSGVYKNPEDMEYVLSTYGGKGVYTVESLQHLQILNDTAVRLGMKITVLIRVTSGNQFGMDEEAIEKIIASRDQFPMIKVCGIHFFSGTQKKTAEKFSKEIAYLDKFCWKIEQKYGFTMSELEYGPGIAVPYFKDQEDTLEADIEVIKTAISGMKWKGKVMLEMGRAFAASCGYYLTCVHECKKNNDRNYCIVDGGMHQIQYDGQIRGMYQPKCRMYPDGREGKKEKWTICGALCTANDVLVRDIELTAPGEGSVIIFENAGAYAMTEGMSLFLSHELPAVVFYSEKEGFKLARNKQETYKWNMEDHK